MQLEKLTPAQALARFNDPKTGGMIDLRRCDLTQANMQNTSLKEAFSRIATLIEAERENPPFFIDMSESDISGCDLRGYDLTGVVMSNINAQRAVFVQAVMSDTHLENADLQHADLREADLYHTKLYDAKIDGANFSGARMAHTHGIGNPETVVERLGVASTIRDAILPENLEPYREYIQHANRANRGEEAPVYATELINDIQDLRDDASLKRINYSDSDSGEMFDDAWIERNSKLW